MKLCDFLTESLSNIVYHFTSISNAIKILENNTFALSSAMAKSAEQEYAKNHYFYLSTTRTKLGNYGHNNSEMICFVLDGNKLNQQYSGESVDYWLQRKNGKDEAEDRLWTGKPYIKDVNQYIIRLDVFISERRMETHEISNLRNLVEAANKNNITINFYNSPQDFVASRRAIDASDYLAQHSKEGPEPKTYDRTRHNPMLNYIDALKGINLENENVERIIYNAKYYPYDVYSLLKADAHNNATTDAMREFTQLALKFKLKNLKQVSDYIIKKYSNQK